MIELRFDEAMALAISSWQDCTEEDKPKIKAIIRAIHCANIVKTATEIALDPDKNELQKQIETYFVVTTPPPFDLHLLKKGGYAGKSVSTIGKEVIIPKSETVNHISELKMLKQVLNQLPKVSN